MTRLAREPWVGSASATGVAAGGGRRTDRAAGPWPSTHLAAGDGQCPAGGPAMPRGALEAGLAGRGRSYAAPRLSPVCILPQPCTGPWDLPRTQVLAAHMPRPDALKNWPERSCAGAVVRTIRAPEPHTHTHTHILLLGYYPVAKSPLLLVATTTTKASIASCQLGNECGGLPPSLSPSF